jgi:hypothetical protein
MDSCCNAKRTAGIHRSASIADVTWDKYNPLCHVEVHLRTFTHISYRVLDLKLTDTIIHFMVSTVQFHFTHKFVRIGYEGNIYNAKFRIRIDLSKV